MVALFYQKVEMNKKSRRAALKTTSKSEVVFLRLHPIVNG